MSLPQDQSDQEEVYDPLETQDASLMLPVLTYKEADYSRPPLSMCPGDALTLMCIDIDYYVLSNSLVQKDDPLAVLRLYTITQSQNSVLVHVKGFVSYFYIDALKGTNPIEFLKWVNQRIGEDIIVKINEVQKESVRGYKGENGRSLFWKIYAKQPSFVAKLRSFFEKGQVFQNQRVAQYGTYESNMPFALRFMIDKKIGGMSWVSIPSGTYTVRDQKRHLSRCQLEIDVNYENINPEHEISDIAPLRILSFDIECSPLKGFPFPERDPVIQIATICQLHTEEIHFVKTIFTLKECANIVGAEVRSFEKEEDLLRAWERFIQVSDPDFITGYNIQNFDFTYILDRAKFLKMNNFGYFGRMVAVPSKIKDGKYLSKAMGMRDCKEMNMEGRVQLDMILHMHREHKLSSYSLNSVSFQFLKEQKEDVHHTIIYSLQNGNPDTRRRIATYCLKDALLPLRLLQKFMCIYNYTEMARVTGVPINFLFTRGQQIKVASQLYRKAAQVEMIIPTERSKGEQDKYKGATVIEPKSGYYRLPITTLDFSSLYPSIMIAHNLCYSTLIPPSIAKTMDPNDYTVAPKGGFCFAKPRLRSGLLPQILEELLSARKKAKAELAVEKDPFKKAVLDGRQLALKISANSVYGFTGAQVGQLPCLEISSTVTAFGREMIEKTKSLVEELYSQKNGFPYDSVVIYGDTDSVMVKFGVETVQEAMKLGQEAAIKISSYFIKPIKLEFEKVYYPYLLFNRKRYAGLLWTKPEKYDKIDTKGIESVRRDNCALVREMMNECLRLILIEQSVNDAIIYVKNTVAALLQNKIDLAKLVITKALTKKTYEKEEQQQQVEQQQAATKDKKGSKQPSKDSFYKQRQAHATLAEKMRKRDAGTAPSIGDRVQFVMVAGMKGSKNFENAEDPVEVLEKNLPIDFNYYIEKQLKAPLKRIFENVIPNADSLFQGEHTKIQHVHKFNQTNTGLGKFVVVKATCLNCKAVLKDQEAALCPNCQPKVITVYKQKLDIVNELGQSYSELWTECQRCQGNLHLEMLCSNRDCQNFYKRKKVQKDLEEAVQVLSKFDHIN